MRAEIQPVTESLYRGDFTRLAVRDIRNERRIEFPSRLAAENAAFVVLVMEFGTTDMFQSAGSLIHFRCGEHPDKRRSEVNP